jgi:HPt (histidine-containing phosphotransfer) domain-containing protein
MMQPGAVREIYVAVINDLDKRIAVLHDALDAGDRGEIRRIGHAIKGGCGMAGALQAARIGAQLEVKGDKLDNVPQMLVELKVAAQNLRRMLEAEFPLS